ncbi:VOC family protein [Aquipseudomonas guryensis]|jgi:catechol 2,3-dioxygenase-like lactoylglutathione lyase family enzyme|uniref:VOC family protein n=1 Tax=Aquipseudomonas guryensis TaxID=2759165 RepID=A0A7W4DD82_9GAMM|nr:VOC family protein [Pseudomonas guryensis]MBB1520429.1 VOC family protein [Pseudomonas guryensis]
MSEPNPSILSHVSIGSNRFDQAVAFYDKVLATLGCKRILAHPGAVAWGREYPEFWVQTPINGQPANVGNGTHFGFVAPDKEAVQAFYAAALEAGASPDGPPGPRPDYGEPYYGCFVRDLDGHKIEAAYWDMEQVYELYTEPHNH